MQKSKPDVKKEVYEKPEFAKEGQLKNIIAAATKQDWLVRCLCKSKSYRKQGVEKGGRSRLVFAMNFPEGNMFL